MNKYYTIIYGNIVYYHVLLVKRENNNIYPEVYAKVLEKFIGILHVEDYAIFHINSTKLITDKNLINRLDKLMVFS